jgi:uncharacterized membrane protein YphA (DoxX/SURF4 family)
MSKDLTVLVARLALSYVYLYAGYLNVKRANREWLLSHTALLLPSGTSPFFIGAAAFVGVAMMFAGGFLVLVGLATWFGCALLIVFTILGYWQHCREVEFATTTADALSAQVDPLLAGASNGNGIRGQLSNLRISAYSGQFSSGLKNWGLVGAFMLLGSVGAGALSLDSYLTKFRPNRLIDLMAWPM